MLLRYFYDTALAHASYLVGCQRSKTALVIDPGRDVDQYLQAAARENLQITAVAETHIHADYVSGARELADRLKAKLYVSDAGPAEWKYQYLEAYDHQLLQDGDSFAVGNIRFDVLHTPGHTPESLSFMLTDQGGGADQPMGIFTGDFVFVGSIGRPDLLEEAAGIANTAEPGARDLFHSAQRFKQLPDYLQIWPAHGAGSACGKGLGAIPSSTVGYEKRFNPALQFEDQEEFVRYILADQPEAPKYFALMKQVNKEGPRVLGDESPDRLGDEHLEEAQRSGVLVDLSSSEQFAAGHVPGALNFPLNMLAGWSGWVLDDSEPVYLIGEPSQFPEAVRVLHKIGVEKIGGLFERDALGDSGRTKQTYASVPPAELAQPIANGDVVLWDVRSDSEWKQERIEQAEHHFLGRLADNLPTAESKPIVVQCYSGGRSAIAASLLQAAGKQVINMAGGIAAWRRAKLPLQQAGAGCMLGESCS